MSHDDAKTQTTALITDFNDLTTPDLLSASKNALKVLEHGKPEIGSVATAIVQLRLAIAKAEGK